MSGVVAECCLVGRIWYGRDVGDGVWVLKNTGTKWAWAVLLGELGRE